MEFVMNAWNFFLLLLKKNHERLLLFVKNIFYLQYLALLSKISRYNWVTRKNTFFFCNMHFQLFSFLEIEFRCILVQWWTKREFSAASNQEHSQLCTKLYCTKLHCTNLYYTILYFMNYIVLYFNTFNALVHSTAMNCTILYCKLPYCHVELLRAAKNGWKCQFYLQMHSK